MPDSSKICGAKTRAGTPCKKPPVAGKKRCRMHGGLTPVGPASPHYQNGRHSRYMPTGIAEKFRIALDDPELTSLREEIAACDAMIATIWEQFDEGQGSTAWKAVLEHLDKANAAGKAGNGELLMHHVTAAQRLSDASLRQIALRDDLLKIIGRRKSLVDSEQRRELQQHLMIPIVQVQILLDALTDVVFTTVQDQGTRSTLAREISRRLRESSILDVEPAGIEHLDGSGQDSNGSAA